MPVFKSLALLLLISLLQSITGHLNSSTDYSNLHLKLKHNQFYDPSICNSNTNFTINENEIGKHLHILSVQSNPCFYTMRSMKLNGCGGAKQHSNGIDIIFQLKQPILEKIHKGEVILEKLTVGISAKVASVGDAISFPWPLPRSVSDSGRDWRYSLLMCPLDGKDKTNNNVKFDPDSDHQWKTAIDLTSQNPDQLIDPDGPDGIEFLKQSYLDLNILRSFNIYRVHLALSLDGLLASAIPVGELAKLSVPIYAYYKTISTGDIKKQYLGSVDLIYLEILEASHKSVLGQKMMTDERVKRDHNECFDRASKDYYVRSTNVITQAQNHPLSKYPWPTNITTSQSFQELFDGLIIDKSSPRVKFMDLIQNSEESLLINFMVKEQNDRSSFGRPFIKTNLLTNIDLGQIQACSSKVCNFDHLQNISPHFSLRKYSFTLKLKEFKPREVFCLTISGPNRRAKAEICIDPKFWQPDEQEKLHQYSLQANYKTTKNFSINESVLTNDEAGAGIEIFSSGMENDIRTINKIRARDIDFPVWRYGMFDNLHK